MRKQLVNYFEFTRSERQGFATLMMMCTVAFLAPEVGRLLLKPKTTDFEAFKAEIATFLQQNGAATIAPQAVAESFNFNPNTASFDDFVRLGLSERLANTILNYRDKGGKFYDEEDFQKMYGLAPADFERLRDYLEFGHGAPKFASYKDNHVPLKVEYFPFDPNTASENDLRRLGLPDKTVVMLLKYRDKGGTFRKTEDLKKMYSLSEQDYNRIAPYVRIEAPVAAAAAPRPMQYGSAAMPAMAFAPKSMVAIDINQATQEDWQQLTGIGATRAQKIMAFREKLGGFAHAGQVAEVRGLPDSVFQQIKPFLRANTPVSRKIDLNKATLEAFGAHPYFDAKQAGLIIAYRAQHGNFKTVDELGNIIPLKNKEWLAKVRPYLVAE